MNEQVEQEEEGTVGVMFKTSPEFRDIIKEQAHNHRMSMTTLIVRCIEKSLGLPETSVHRMRLNRREKELRPIQRAADPRTAALPSAFLNVKEFYCPICKFPMEETAREDRIDQYGTTHYHSCDLQLECTHCRTGHGIILNMPYRD
jgi:hypothetical protein